MVKIWQSSRLVCYGIPAGFHTFCIWHVSICSYQGKLKLSRVLITLMSVAYTGKPMSLVDMDLDNHTAMIMHTIWHEYASIAKALNAYPHHKFKSTHDHKRAAIPPSWQVLLCFHIIFNIYYCCITVLPPSTWCASPFMVSEPLFSGQ